MEKERIKEMATLVLTYYKKEDARNKLADLTEEERQKVLEEITAQLGR